MQCATRSTSFPVTHSRRSLSHTTTNVTSEQQHRRLDSSLPLPNDQISALSGKWLNEEKHQTNKQLQSLSCVSKRTKSISFRLLAKEHLHYCDNVNKNDRRFFLDLSKPGWFASNGLPRLCKPLTKSLSFKYSRTFVPTRVMIIIDTATYGLKEIER